MRSFHFVDPTSTPRRATATTVQPSVRSVFVGPISAVAPNTTNALPDDPRTRSGTRSPAALEDMASQRVSTLGSQAPWSLQALTCSRSTSTPSAPPPSPSTTSVSNARPGFCIFAVDPKALCTAVRPAMAAARAASGDAAMASASSSMYFPYWWRQSFSASMRLIASVLPRALKAAPKMRFPCFVVDTLLSSSSLGHSVNAAMLLVEGLRPDLGGNHAPSRQYRPDAVANGAFMAPRRSRPPPR